METFIIIIRTFDISINHHHGALVHHHHYYGSLVHYHHHHNYNHHHDGALLHHQGQTRVETLMIFKTFDSNQSFACSPPRDSHYHWFKTPPPPHEENILGCCLWLIIKVALKLELGGLWLIIEVAHNLLRAVTLWPVRTFFSPQTCTSVLSNKGQSPVCESS